MLRRKGQQKLRAQIRRPLEGRRLFRLQGIYRPGDLADGLRQKIQQKHFRCLIITLAARLGQPWRKTLDTSKSTFLEMVRRGN